MAMFGAHRAGSAFSNLLRDNRNKKKAVPASTSGTRGVGMPKGPVARSSRNPGGVATRVPSARTIPAATPHESNFTPAVPRGTGQRVGSQNRKEPPANPPNRLGAMGMPPGHSTGGPGDMPAGGMERKGNPGATSFESRFGKKVRSSGGRGRPRKSIGDAHINKGRPRIAASPRVIRELAERL